MEKCITNIKAINQLFQVLDGSFPSGSFVHSFGLEPHVLKENITNADELKVFLTNLIKYQYNSADFSFVRRVYQHLVTSKWNLLVKEDNNYSAMMSFEYSKASKELGANYLKQIDLHVKKEIVKEYFFHVKSAKAYGNELAILSAFAYDLDIAEELFLSLWCKKNIVNIAMASLKISRIKPSDIQQLLFEIDDEITSYIYSNKKEYTLFNPLFEEIVFQHKFLEPKLFVT